MSAIGHHHFTTFPTVPPSLSAGDHGMRDYDSIAEHNANRATSNTVQNITPYLGLRSRMSQVWINRWTVLLFLVLVRLLIAIAGLNHDLASAKTEAMSACSGVESMGSAMASMPHYLSAGVNELAASGVEKAVRGLMSMLLLTITGVEELLIFYIHMLTSTYLCLITLVVRGSLHAALKVIEEAGEFVNKTLQDVSKGIGKTVDDFDDGLNKFTGALNSVPKVFGGKSDDIPKIDLSEQQKVLTEFKLPGDLDQGLSKLNNSIPTFDEVQNFIDDIIRLPFEEVKKLINGSLHFNFNRSMLPVPQKKKLNFCSENNEISNFFDNMANLTNDARKVFIAILVILAIGICIPMAYREIRRYRVMQDRAQLVTDKSFDPLDVVYINSRPYTATAGIKIASAFGSTRKQVLVRWIIAYATSTPALVVLSLGFTGLFSCLCQYALLRAIEKKAPELAHEVGEFADKVVGSLNTASAAWANDTNAAVVFVNDGVNHDVFGWVNTTTGAVNKTLDAFVEKTIGVLNDTFGKTILHEPMLDLFNCLIGLKIAAVQKGLTWVSDHAKVDFPRLPNDTFSLGAAAAIADDSPDKSSAESFLANSGAKTTDRITGAVSKVVRHLSNGIRTEAIISTCMLLVWLIVLLLGVSRAVWLLLHGDKTRGEGGPAVSDGVRLPDRPTTFGPAPAYEPPRSAVSGTTNPFSEQAAVIPSRRSSAADEHQWQDEKLGFAGMRQPAREESPTRDPRRSVYPTLEKS